MFTGLVEEVGKVISVIRGTGAQIRVQTKMIAGSTQLGDSIAVNGICLTVTSISGNEVAFDAVEETITKSSLSKLRSGDKVNLERAVSADRLFGGHFVLGHVDGTGTIAGFDKTHGAATLSIRAPETIMCYIVPKGSIAIDGISLTVASVVNDSTFTVAIIPHTIENTTLVNKRPGDIVNLEGDIIGKYVEKFVSARQGSGSITSRFLADNGFTEE